jgi:hypothetical protein
LVRLKISWRNGRMIRFRIYFLVEFLTFYHLIDSSTCLIRCEKTKPKNKGSQTRNSFCYYSAPLFLPLALLRKDIYFTGLKLTCLSSSWALLVQTMLELSQRRAASPCQPDRVVCLGVCSCFTTAEPQSKQNL